MTRPADPRGADRRKPSTFGAETGYDNAEPTRRPARKHVAKDRPGPCQSWQRVRLDDGRLLDIYCDRVPALVQHPAFSGNVWQVVEIIK